MPRIAYTSQLTYSQPEFLAAGVPVVGLVPADLTFEVWYNGNPLPWLLVPGLNVSDSRVVAGSVYLHETAPGVYLIRWIPAVSGYWKMVFIRPGVFRTVEEYDTVVQSPDTETLVYATLSSTVQSC